MKQNRLITIGGEPLNEVAAFTVSGRVHVDTLPELTPVGRRRRRRRRSVIGPIVATVLIAVVAAMS